MTGTGGESTKSVLPGREELPIQVSVVIPTLRLVVEAIESVLAQTLSRVELIVVDDEATDDTVGALAPFGGRIHSSVYRW